MDPAMDADLVALGDQRALLLGMQQGGHGGHVEGRLHIVLLQQFADARHADPVAGLAPGHAADRLAAIAQLVGLVVGIEGERHGAARAVLPRLGPVALAGAHLGHQLAPVLLAPLPGFQLRDLCIGHDDLPKIQASGEPVTGRIWPVIHDARSDARNSTASAMSSGRAHAPHGDTVGECAAEVLAVGIPLPLVVRAGGHEARRHGIDGDAERPQLLGELLHQPDLAVLGRGIGLDAGQAGGEPGPARDRDDASAAGLLHAGRHGAGEQEAAQKVGVDDGRKVLRCDLFQGLGPLAQHAACDIDQHVDPAAGLLYDGVDAGRLGDVDRQGLDAVTGLDLGHQPIAGQHGGAVVGKGAGDRATDAARGAGDDDRLAVETDIHDQASSSTAAATAWQLWAEVGAPIDTAVITDPPNKPPPRLNGRECYTEITARGNSGDRPLSS